MDRSSDWLSRLVNPFCPKVAPGESEELRRQYRAVVIFGYFGILIVAGFARLNAKLGNTLAAQVQYAMALAAVGALFLNKRGLVRTTAHACLVITSITIGIGMWTGGGMEAAAVLFLPVLPVVGLLTVGRGGGLTGAIEALTLVAVVATLQKLGFEPRHDPADKLFVKRVAEASAAIVQVWVFCGIFFRVKHEAFSLLERNRDELARLFDGMTQGVLTFDAGGTVVGRWSASATQIFGRSSFENASVVELLYADRPEYDLARQELVGFLEVVFAVAPEQMVEALALAPRTCVRNEGKPSEQHLVLEFRPLVEQDKISRVLLLVTDDTERVQLERARDREKNARAQALAEMRRQSALGARPFLEFLRLSEERLSSLRQSLASCAQLAEVERALRAVHTVRGEAKVHDLDALSDTCEALEATLARIRACTLANEAPVGTDLSLARELLEQGLREAAEARETLVAGSPIGPAVLDQVTVSAKDLQHLWDTVRSPSAATREALAPLAARLLARPFGESVGSLSDALQRWCEQEGKRAALAVGGRDVRVGPTLFEVLPGVLAHLVRNAVAHGIEPVAARESHGKNALGRVDIVCEDGPNGPVVRVRDDGAGIDAAAVERRAKDLGLFVPGTDVTELIFVDGLSTAPEVTALRGRGVGMSAVRADLAQVGYDIHVESSPGKGTSFVLEPRNVHASAAE